MRTPKVIATTADVMQLLERHEPLSVQSVFHNGFNLRNKESLIFVGPRPVPFGICVAPANLFDLRWLTQDTVVTYANQKLIFKSTVNEYGLDLEAVPLIDLHIPANVDLKRLEQELEPLNLMTGLDMTYDEVFALDAVQALFRKDYSAGINWLKGRGKGLTPSGDDILVGITAVLQTVDPKHPLITTMADTIKPSDTTSIAYEYIKYALDGKFGQDVVDVFVDPAENLPLLLSLGHSSGRDTVCGMKIGLALLKEN